MKSKTLYFNPSAIQKNVTRFAPVWALYSVMWLLIFITALNDSVDRGMAWGNIGYWLAEGWGSSLQMMSIPNCAYAFLCAQVLFGDLYNSRMCNALHALPLRRESWFVTHVLSGLGFSLVPNLVICVLVMACSGSSWSVAPVWLLGMTLQFLFFFGVAVFSAYCVGNRFAMLLMYGLINGLSLLVLAMLESLYMPMLYGLRLDAEPFIWFCPLLKMCTFDQILTIDTISELRDWENGIIVEGVKLSGPAQLGEGWGYLAVCALIGLLFMGLGLLVYRKRNLECAGDFLAVRWLRPVFLVLYCLCAGMAGYLFFSLFVGEETLFFLVVGLVLGWFTGKMLLERNLRVFGKKSWLCCGALVLVLMLSLGLTKLDFLGLTRWLPAPESVRSVTVWVDGSEQVAHTDPNTLEVIAQIHRYGIENPQSNYNGAADTDVYLEYKMKTGATVSRTYTVDINTEAGKTLEKLLSQPAYVLGADDLAAFRESLILVTTWDGYLITDHDALFAAIEKDCLAGNMAQTWAFHRDDEHFIYLEFEYLDENRVRQHWSVNVFESCENTISYLKALGYEPMK